MVRRLKLKPASMITLKELEDLGVKELRVEKGQAVAVNPYEQHIIKYCSRSNRRYLNPEWKEIDSLPPLPTSGVHDGIISIEDVEEVKQRFDEAIFNEWKDEGDTYMSPYAKKKRTALRLKQPPEEYKAEPVAESEWTGKLTTCTCGCFVFDKEAIHCVKCGKSRLDEVTEKPEGESEYYPGIEYQELFNHMSEEHGLNLTQSQLYDIALVAKNLTSPPEAEPVESAEEFYMQVQERECPHYNYFIIPEPWQVKAMEEYASLRVAQALKK